MRRHALDDGAEMLFAADTKMRPRKSDVSFERSAGFCGKQACVRVLFHRVIASFFAQLVAGV